MICAFGSTPFIDHVSGIDLVSTIICWIAGVWVYIFCSMQCIMQIEFENRHIMSELGEQCKIMVNGMDFCIQEPVPFDPSCHKFKGPGLYYEVGVCIKTGWIVWVNASFPAGEWSDLQIVRSALIQNLEDDEFYVADGGYNDGYQWVETPTGHNNPKQRIYALAQDCQQELQELWDSCQ